MMLVFLCISLLLILSQMGMFIFPIYRVTFNTWTFFGAITVLAYLLLNFTFFMSLVCRYFFGRGLAHYLHVQNALNDCDFTPVYIERGDFPGAAVGDCDMELEGGVMMPWDVKGTGGVKKLRLEIGTMAAPSVKCPSTTSSPSFQMSILQGT